MCRNIKPLFNFEPEATHQEIHDASLQFVRKVSGYTHPSQANEDAFNQAVEDIAHIAHHLMHDLTTNADPRNREVEAQKAHERALKRFGTA